MNTNHPAVPTFPREALVAALLAIGGAFLLNSAWLVESARWHLVASSPNLWLNALVGAYLLYLCARSRTKRSPQSGGPTLMLVWLLGSIAAIALGLGPIANAAWQVLMISVTRTLLFYPQWLRLLMDLVLSTAAALAALWVSLQSSSALLAIWTFFLVQAGWTWVAAAQQQRSAPSARAKATFEAAHATAAAAIRRLTRRHTH